MNMVKAMVGPFFDNRKADIENNVENDAYLESKVLNRILIECENSKLRVDVNNLLNEMVASVDTHRLNRERPHCPTPHDCSKNEHYDYYKDHFGCSTCITKFDNDTELSY